MKIQALVGIAALAGLTACTITHENFLIEVSESSPDIVRVTAMDGVLKLKGEALADANEYINGMAAAECQKYGKSGASQQGERRYRGGPWNAYIERTYRCV